MGHKYENDVNCPLLINCLFDVYQKFKIYKRTIQNLWKKYKKLNLALKGEN